MLQELAAASGDSIMDTTRAAATALRRQRFARRVADELQTMQQRDPDAWAEYLAEAGLSDVTDGVD